MEEPAHEACISLSQADDERLSVFKVALENILSLPAVELTYAQIVDGLPLRDVFLDSHSPLPSILSQHFSLCDGALDRVREARNELDTESFLFQRDAVERYGSSSMGSVAFALRLIELLAVACHQIAATLYERNNSIHSRDSVQAEMHKYLEAAERPWQRSRLPQYTYFYNSHYTCTTKYPRGVADVVGYWAETRIFGGVVVFDRGYSDDGNNGVYFHSDRRTFGSTLYPPTDAQLKSLVRFLTLPAVDECPLPITPTSENRWRWDPGLAFAQWNIFRDRYGRSVPEDYRPNRHKLSEWSWPEVGDELELMVQAVAGFRGEPVDGDAIARARENMKRITPTSPKWDGPQPDKNEHSPQWKPPYFQGQVEEEDTSRE